MLEKRTRWETQEVEFGNFSCEDNKNRLPAVQPERGDGPVCLVKVSPLLPLGCQETTQRSAIIFSRLFSQACFSCLVVCVSHRLKVVGSHTLSDRREALSPQQLRHSKNFISLSFLKNFFAVGFGPVPSVWPWADQRRQEFPLNIFQVLKSHWMTKAFIDLYIYKL